MVLITIIDDTKPAKEPVTGRITVDEARNCYEWVLTPKQQKIDVTGALTLQDRRELAKDNLNTETINVRAKTIYAAGGRIKDIQSGCGIGKDYAKKLHAAFGRASKKTGA